MAYLHFKNSTVLITGASSGIGKEFARNLANQGANLIITARTETKLIELAHQLEQENKDIWVKVIVSDLSLQGEARNLYSNIESMGLCVDYLINNAGFGKWSDFLGESIDTYSSMLALNINSLVELSYFFIPNMVKKNSGGIINVASTASFQSMPYQAVYGASKTFVLNFSESLSGELLNTNVRIMALCPGATKSNFMVNANADTSGISLASASSVVDSALIAYSKNRIYTVSGKVNYFTSLIPRFFSRQSVVKIIVNMFKGKISKKSIQL
jgi:short-subunit dehydrogenase